MKRIALGVNVYILLITAHLSICQSKIATLADDGQLIITEDYNNNRPLQFRDSVSALYRPMPGFPKAFEANPAFKNFRNITLADINSDGLIDVVGATGTTLWVWSYPDTLLWTQPLLGTPIYPPSVGDLDGNGQLEIILNTAGGTPANGKVYIFSHQGRLLNNWPKNFNNNLMLLAPCLADVDGKGNLEIITIERVSGGGSFLHVLNLQGKDLPGWPAFFTNTLAVTPTVADLDGNGDMEIVVATTRELYVLDHTGLVKKGWPFSSPYLRFSYQSPVAVDLDSNGDLEIIGSTNGDDPEYYVLEHDGQYHPGWPSKVPDQHWTYSSPSLWLVDGHHHILMGRPLYDDMAAPMLFAWNGQGQMVQPFPLVKTGGCEGIISIADLNGDGSADVFFESNRLEEERGFIHALDLTTLEELEGFPLRPRGWTFMNGASTADVNNDGWTDLVFLSYTEHPGSTPDTAFLNIYTSTIPYNAKQIQWNTYKGNNLRNGNFRTDITTALPTSKPMTIMSISPNPADDYLYLHVNDPIHCRITAFDLIGRMMVKTSVNVTKTLDIRHWKPGIYFLLFQYDNQRTVTKILKR